MVASACLQDARMTHALGHLIVEYLEQILEYRNISHTQWLRVLSRLVFYCSPVLEYQALHRKPRRLGKVVMGAAVICG